MRNVLPCLERGWARCLRGFRKCNSCQGGVTVKIDCLQSVVFGYHLGGVTLVGK